MKTHLTVTPQARVTDTSSWRVGLTFYAHRRVNDICTYVSLLSCILFFSGTEGICRVLIPITGVRNMIRGRPDADAQMSCRRGDARMTRG